MIFFILISFGILGAGIKYIDAAYDEKTFNKKIALCAAPFLGILWAYTMIMNPVAATILLSVVIGVFFKGKIDNFAHLAGLVVILAIIFFTGVQLLIIPLIILGLAALLDEFGNDFIDKRKDKMDVNKLTHKFVISFFNQRWVLKVAILGLCITGSVPILFFLAMIVFDYSYVSVGIYSQSKQITKPLVKPIANSEQITA